MGFNRYSYAVNNPYKYTDPDGKAICAGVCVAAVGLGVREGVKACAKNAACRGAVVKGAKRVADAVSSVLGAVFNESSSADEDDEEKKDDLECNQDCRDEEYENYQDGTNKEIDPMRISRCTAECRRQRREERERRREEERQDDIGRENDNL
jgi:hypothetical protein